MLLIDGVEHRCGGRDGAVDEEEDGFLGRQFQALSDHIHKLTASEIRRDQILLLVNVLEKDVRMGS